MSNLLKQSWFWLLLILLVFIGITNFDPPGKFESPVQAALDKGQKHLLSGRVTTAEKEFRSAIELTSQKRRAYMSIIDIYAVSGNRLGRRADEIIADYLDELLLLNEQKRLDKPFTKDELFGLLRSYGIFCSQINRIDDAVSALEKALEIRPNDPGTANDLGYIYADNGRSLDRALELTRKAVKANPNESMFIDSLGWAYYKLGRSKDAVHELKRAVKMCPYNADLRYHLGAAYSQLGKNVEATIELRKSLCISPGFADARILLDKIERNSRSNARNL